MSFETVADFLHMGGHALYVWMVFGVSALAIGINLFNLSRLRRLALQAAAEDALLDTPEATGTQAETQAQLSEKSS